MPIDLAADSGAAGGLHKWFREKRIHVLHSHAGISWEGQQVVRVARSAGVAAIVRTEHLPYLVTNRQQQIEHRQTISLVDRLICVSDEARRSFLQKGFSPDKLVTVRNGISVLDFRNRNQKLHESLKLARHVKIVLTVARFSEQKGHKYLLQALPRVLAIQPSTLNPFCLGRHWSVDSFTTESGARRGFGATHLFLRKPRRCMRVDGWSRRLCITVPI